MPNINCCDLFIEYHIVLLARAVIMCVGSGGARAHARAHAQTHAQTHAQARVYML